MMALNIPGGPAAKHERGIVAGVVVQQPSKKIFTTPERNQPLRGEHEKKIVNSGGLSQETVSGATTNLKQEG